MKTITIDNIKDADYTRILNAVCKTYKPECCKESNDCCEDTDTCCIDAIKMWLIRTVDSVEYSEMVTEKEAQIEEAKEALSPIDL